MKDCSRRQLSVLIPNFLVRRVIESLNSVTGFKKIPVTNRYEALRGVVGDKAVIVYQSGSVVYDRSLKEVKDTIEEVLYEYYRGEGTIIGSDEAGKGEALGPLTVAAVALSPRQAAHLQSIGVMDSKLIPDSRIFKLARKVRETSLAHSVLEITPSKINKMLEEGRHGNLNDILAMGHAKALKKVVSKIREKSFKIIVDKFDSSKDNKRLRMIEEYLNGIKVYTIVGGEAYPAVAAASILARAAYLKWVFNNIGEAAFSKIKKGDYSMIKEGEKHLYFKVRYMKDFKDRK